MNAIILAAGIGKRIYPLSKNIPKPLIKINNETIIERQIKFLKEVGINDITIVTGYLHNKFSFLEKKFKVNIVFNPKYDIYNNIYSMYLVRDLLNDTYLLEADIYHNRNIFKTDSTNCIYISAKKPLFKNEWVLDTDENNKINKISIQSGNNKYIIQGGAYITGNNSKFIKNQLEEIYNTNRKLFKNYYWDDILINNITKIDDIYLYPLKENDIYEIDTLYDYYTLKNLVEK